ncbi:Peptidase S66, LD-carboxypeptidase A [Penicillium expansum]|uniref:Peptidase S66, LD-carboxypeptidase A n=1 Tax=Penicillium expansum TaxID=27334 RepID=A0A0A2IPM5_PENEN|nr:Peptidase S66, LD-carboxypeptidase A [Penicillium expansum]KGO36202.1 Peptidase S66, LD-carboxypeptidase A [Penicillium expansum]KGO44408.1 Peptidase S66, LD-carboxypeptidase A [Penicillium expansum]KGO62061.1 Peptidase S66, LD-carboxypeptidase A [Penicillium expansum]
MYTIIPKALKKGDTIAFISPSARLNDILATPLSRGKAYLESLGFRVQIIFTGLTTTTIAESVRIRCEELHSAFRDNTIAAVICTIGGSHANEMLPFLDYSLIRSNPKVFVGYSDATFLHYAIQSQTGLRTFYGPSVLTDLSDFPKPMQFTIDHFLHVLTETGNPVGTLPRSPICSVEHTEFLLNEADKAREVVESPSWRWLRKGRATGRLYGGTIICVVRLQGTNYAPSWEGNILFLESAMGDDMQLPYSVSQFRNNLVDLALSGMLHKISGLVIGRGYKYDDRMHDELASLIEEVFDVIVGREEELPILMNVDFGHTSPFLTLPIGALVGLDSEIDEFKVMEPGVQA